ncbi:hypothetical protein FOL47_002762 [Perkinsus chesapeaki]|uniref:Uncharacterized protein n=1 Tax=Perkinsus chesapeaki TaxID=330153 RepID=A0A7J6MZZ5_PERCH|nr:hypothetical protein FOL47_002762 [Perkinsus chesapeaki]
MRCILLLSTYLISTSASLRGRSYDDDDATKGCCLPGFGKLCRKLCGKKKDSGDLSVAYESIPGFPSYEALHKSHAFYGSTPQLVATEESDDMGTPENQAYLKRMFEIEGKISKKKTTRF